jgi:predicted DsbA family dithiol-disulfide isomerase
MAKIEIPSGKIIHYVDSYCPWTLCAEPYIRKVEYEYDGMIKVEYRCGVAVDNIDTWFKETGFNLESVKSFHKSIIKKSKIPFDEAFIEKTGLKTSLNASKLYFASKLINEKNSRKFLRLLLDSFVVKSEKESQELFDRLAKNSNFNYNELVNLSSSSSFQRRFLKEVSSMQVEGATFYNIIFETLNDKIVIDDIFDSNKLESIIEENVAGIQKQSVPKVEEYLKEHENEMISLNELELITEKSRKDIENDLEKLRTKYSITRERVNDYDYIILVK